METSRFGPGNEERKTGGMEEGIGQSRLGRLPKSLLKSWVVIE